MAATIWKGRLNFGLVSIPIKLVRAARAEKIHMHRLQRDTGTRVRQVFLPVVPEDVELEPEPMHAPLDGTTLQKAAPVAAARRPEPAREPAPEAHRQPPPLTPPPPKGLTASQMVKGFEVEKDKYVEFEPEELERLAPRNSPDMQIVEFVHFAEVDPVYLETSYYVGPDRGGEKPYALLFEVLKKTGYAAIGEFVMHRRDQILIIRPGRHGLIAHTLFYDDEVKRDNEFHADAGMVQGKEMELAVKLVEALSGTFDPSKFKDQYRERLQQAIAEKTQAHPLRQSPPIAVKAPVVDIMAALQESLAKARKPVASEATPVPPRKQRTARGK